MRRAVVVDHLHDLVDRLGLVVHPVQQPVVAGQLEQVHGEAAEEVAQPGTVARVRVERIVAAHADRQDVAEDVLQEVTPLVAQRPIQPVLAQVELVSIGRGLESEIERVGQVAAIGADRMMGFDGQPVVADLDLPRDAEVGVHDDVVADLVGVADDLQQRLFDVAEVRILADELVRADVVGEHARLQQDHRLLHPQILDGPPLPAALNHDRVGGVRHPPGGKRS